MKMKRFFAFFLLAVVTLLPNAQVEAGRRLKGSFCCLLGFSSLFQGLGFLSSLKDSTGCPQEQEYIKRDEVQPCSKRQFIRFEKDLIIVKKEQEELKKEIEQEEAFFIQENKKLVSAEYAKDKQRRIILQNGKLSWEQVDEKDQLDYIVIRNSIDRERIRMDVLRNKLAEYKDALSEKLALLRDKEASIEAEIKKYVVQLEKTPIKQELEMCDKTPSVIIYLKRSVALVGTMMVGSGLFCMKRGHNLLKVQDDADVVKKNQ